MIKAALGITLVCMCIVFFAFVPAMGKSAEMKEHGNAPALKHTENGTEFKFFPDNTTLVFSDLTIPTTIPENPINGSVWMDENGILECYMGVWKYCSNGGIIQE